MIDRIKNFVQGETIPLSQDDHKRLLFGAVTIIAEDPAYFVLKTEEGYLAVICETYIAAKGLGVIIVHKTKEIFEAIHIVADQYLLDTAG